jgi:hypothetical protein
LLYPNWVLIAILYPIDNKKDSSYLYRKHGTFRKI